MYNFQVPDKAEHPIKKTDKKNNDKNEKPTQPKWKHRQNKLKKMVNFVFWESLKKILYFSGGKLNDEAINDYENEINNDASEALKRFVISLRNSLF